MFIIKLTHQMILSLVSNKTEFDMISLLITTVPLVALMIIMLPQPIVDHKYRLT